MDTGKNKFAIFGLLGVSIFFYVFISYYIERHQSALLIFSYAGLFITYLAVIRWHANQHFNLLLIGAFVIRLILVFAFPNLSDDIYRFVWDGRLLVNGIHPFAHLPGYYLEQSTSIPGIGPELFQQLNSPDYFTVYPPFAQYVFVFSVIVAPDSVYGSSVVMKVLILMAETGIVFTLIQLCKGYNISRNNVLLYALNPLIILEFAGNLHFEIFMILFLLMSILFLEQNKLMPASIFMALSIVSKLMPLAMLPLFLKRMHWKRWLLFYVLTGLFTLILFLPLFNYELVKGMGSSLSLYFQKFEFNASIYYIVREIGYWKVGYNIIGYAGKWLAIISFLTIMIFSLVHPKKMKLPEAMLWILGIYLMMATTVHPWYISTLVALCLFTTYRFPIVWSLMIFVTYIGYTVDGFSENLWLTFIEYVVVIGYLIYEKRLHVRQIKKTIIAGLGETA